MKNKSQDIYELSPLQEAFLYHSIIDETSSAYFSQVAYEVSGHIDEALFEKSLEMLFDRHSILRTAFVYKGLKKPYQVVIKDRRAELHFKNLSHLSETEQAKYLESFKEQEKLRNFNLTKDSLMRLHIFTTKDSYYHLVWSFHHILFDHWSFTKLVNEFNYFYNCLETGQTPDLPPALPYKQFIKWLEGKNKPSALNYWQQHLAGYEKCAVLPNFSPPINQKHRYDQGEVYLKLGIDRSKQLAQIAAEKKTTLNTLVLCVWGILLARYNNTQDVVFGKISSMRPPEIKNIESMVGLFINPLPIRIRFDRATTFRDLLHTIQQDNLNAEMYNYCSLAEIQSLTDLKKELIDHMLVFGNELADRGEEIEEVKDTQSWQVVQAHHREEVNYDFSMFVTTEEKVDLIFTFNRYCYPEATIQNLADQFEYLVDQILAQPNVCINDLKVLLPREEKQLLDWSGERKDYSPLLFQEVFAEWKDKNPDQVAVVCGDHQLTYRQLDERSDHLAAYLADRYALAYQQRVGLFLDRSEWSVISLLAIWKLGAIYVPVDIQYPMERTREVFMDAQVDLILSQISTVERLPQLDIPSVVVDQLSDLSTIPFAKQKVDSKAIAYIIHTSGTSGKPKRIPLRHESISDRIQYHVDYMQLQPRDKVLHFAALHFDSSLVEIGMALLSGGTLVIADISIKSNSEYLIQLLENQKVTTAIFTPAFLKMLQKHPLPSLENIISTGEAAALEETIFYAANKNFYNGYGPSEACIGATFHKVNPERAEIYQKMGSILIGQPFCNARVYVLDSQQRLLPQGVPGEIAIAGVGVANGYLDHPELSKEKFVANPYQQEKEAAVLYRSGDLGRWTADGELEFLGRIDEQIQIRGIRVELREIEHQIARHPEVRDVRVVARKNETEGLFLVAYVVEAGKVDTKPLLRNYLSQYLPVYMIPTYFVTVAAFPLTTNGKIDFAALPEYTTQLTGQDNNTKSKVTPEEEKMVAIWREVLGDEKIEVTSNFFDHGGHSLKAITLVLNIHRGFEQNIDLQEVFDYPTPRLLLERMSTGSSKAYEKIEKVATQDYYEASPSQKRTWLLTQFDGATTIYNVPGTFLLKGVFEPQYLIQTIQLLLARHEILRTTFFLEEGVLMQRVLPFDAEYLEIAVLDFSEKEAATQDLEALMDQEYEMPFDLEKGPLLRMKIVQLAPDRHLFLYTLHHIIADGWSMQLFFKELMMCYSAFSQKRKPALSELTIQHKDYTHWLLQQLQGEGLAEQRKYWLQQFEGDIPVLDFPADRARPNVKTYTAQDFSFEISPTLFGKLKTFCQQQDVTMFMVLLGGLKTLLARYSQQTDLVVGTVIAGREQAELQEQIGFFSNTLALRTRFDHTDSIHTFLNKVKEVVLGAFKHQSFPFDYLVNELPIKRDIRRSPIFDVLLTHQNVDLFEQERPQVDRLEVQPYTASRTTSARFDLEFIFTEFDNNISGTVLFNTDLYFPATIDRFCTHFVQVLEAYVENAQTSLQDIEMIEAEEQQLLLQDFNDTAVPLGEKTFLHLLEEQVEANPQSLALGFEGKEYTYQQLAQKTNQIAHLLRSDYQIKPEQVIAFYTERDDWWVMGMIGILKSGAVYLPISPSEPESRIRHLLSEAGANLVLTNGTTLSVFDDLPQVDLSKVNWSAIANKPEPEIWPTMNRLAYIIFTSGSTGMPKGVALEHGGMVNHLLAKKEDLKIDKNSIVGQTASHSFDVSVWQSLTALIAGGQTIVYKQELVMDPLRLAKEMNYDEVSVFQVVPSYLASLLDALRQFSAPIGFNQLKYLVVVGEVLPPALVEDWFSQFVFTRIVNHYGPTETCDGVSHYTMQRPPTQATVPIGQPLRNVRVYILDQRQRLCPIGVKGEIYISGVGVGRGYVNQPELTAAAFLPDPFFPGDRMYRTKDLGRWTADGILECFGRYDSQVKIRGHRIELGEIEHAFYRLPFVHKVAILERGDMERGKYLCAYYTLKSGMMATVEETRKRLAEQLPDFMIPEYLCILDALPLTASLKIDRNRLPKPEAMENIITERPVVEPASPTESELLEIWRDVLDITQISTDDNFFEIGGHSFKAIKIQTMFFKKSGIELSIKSIFMHPDIQSLAAFIDANHSVDATSKVE